MTRTCADVLRKAGWPTRILVIDFEAYFQDKKHGGLGFKTQNCVEYVNDPRWETIGLGYQFIDGSDSKPQYVHGPFIREFFRQLQTQYGENLEQLTVVALNCKFDMLVALIHYGVNIEYTLDLLDLLRWYDPKMKHGLKHVAPYFGFQHKGDTMEFVNMKLADLIERGKLKKMVQYCKNDVDLEAQLVKLLLPMFDWPEVELWLAKITTDMYINPQMVLDEELAFEIVDEMRGILTESLHGYTPELLNSDIKTAKELRRLLPPDEKLPTKPGKPTKNLEPLTGKGRGLALAKTDDACKELLNHPLETVRNLIEARMANNSWPNHIAKIERLIVSSRLSSGKVRIPLKSHGAHTHRWSGDEGVNPQNFGSRGLDLITKIRHLLCANLEEDEVLLIADSAQIEARNLAWAAGQQDLIEIFRNDGDPYSDFATELFQKKTWKWGEDDVEEYPGQKKEVKVQRDFGKEGILGGGYGMGGPKMHVRCLQSPGLRPFYDDGTYDEAFSQSVIDTYRFKYKKIPKFWKKVENKFRLVTRHPQIGKQFVHVPGTRQKFIFYNDGKSTFIVLPSGQRLRYRHAVVSAEGRIRYKPRNWEDLYGGKITENIIQAMSRDFLAYWMVQMYKKYGRKCVLTVHDELIYVAKKHEAELVRKQLEEVMTAPVPWADGMPFGVESQLSPHYTK